MPGSTRASFGFGIELRERVHVARVVEDHGHVDALAGEAGARAAGRTAAPVARQAASAASTSAASRGKMTPMGSWR
jgi:hypothetical protein